MSNIERLPLVPHSSTIPESDVSNNRLASILASAVIDNEIDDDGHIYVTDGLRFPAWITIDSDRALLCFFTHYTFDDTLAGIPIDEVVTAVNELNGNHILVQFHVRQKRLFGHFWMTFDSGLDPRHFIKMLRRFSGAFASGVEELSGSLSSGQV